MHLKTIDFNSQSLESHRVKAVRVIYRILAIKEEWFLNIRSIVSETLPGALETLQATTYEFFRVAAGRVQLHLYLQFSLDDCCGSVQPAGRARDKCHEQEVTDHDD